MGCGAPVLHYLRPHPFLSLDVRSRRREDGGATPNSYQVRYRTGEFPLLSVLVNVTSNETSHRDRQNSKTPFITDNVHGHQSVVVRLHLEGGVGTRVKS